MGRIQTGRFWMICSILAAMLSGCSFGDEPSVCPYNVRMEYWYAGSSTENTLPTYVDNLRQYLFDAKGNLLATITLKGDSVAGWNGNLPDGDYTLVLWGNLSDESNANETIQIQNENDMNMNEMTLSAQQTGIPPGYRGNTSRLYYGTTAFTLQNGAEPGSRTRLPVPRPCRPLCDGAVDDRRTTRRRHFQDAAQRDSGCLRIYRRL